MPRARVLTCRVVSVVASTVVLMVPTPAPAGVATSPGPELTAPADALRDSLDCSGELRGSAYGPVLLVAGTGGTPEENYSWNYMPALTARGIPWCGVTVPDHTLADVQDQAQYIVYAIRTMYRRAGRRLAIMGYSQGGMTPRWALRWWPDIRRHVDDMVSLAASNHGTAFAAQMGVCATSCHPAAWQNLPGSTFLSALNAPAETFAGVAYTQIYTFYDELSTPPGPDGTSPLRTGNGRVANIALQDVCPGNMADHLAIGSVDPVAWALVVDALEHPGPADPARIDTAVCKDAVMPGVRLDRAAAAIGAVPFLLSAASPFNLSGVPKVEHPPALRPYTSRPQAVARVRRGWMRLAVIAGTTPITRLVAQVPGRRARTFGAGTTWSVRMRVGRAQRLRLRADHPAGAPSRLSLRLR